MALGVPEDEVFAAADAVLARGERPTVERVRQELGRGSPARVGSLLDIWWGQLAKRVEGETRLPGMPREVTEAFLALWQQATTIAQGVAEQSFPTINQTADLEQLLAERDAQVDDLRAQCQELKNKHDETLSQLGEYREQLHQSQRMLERVEAELGRALEAAARECARSKD